MNTATESVTAGPWHVEKFGGRYEVWRKDDGTIRAYVAVAQRQVDARLIAAAPELLEACKKVLGALGMLGAKGGPLDAARDVARLAINKAEGSL